jgi:hypothetical protein
MERFLLQEYRFGCQYDIALSSKRNGLTGFLGGGCLLSWWSPEMLFYVDAGFDDRNAFGLEKFFLQGGVGFADQDFAVGAKDAMPGDALSGRCGTHGAAGGPCAPRETQGFSKGSISKNPAAGDLFHKLVNRIERHGEATPYATARMGSAKTRKTS